MMHEIVVLHVPGCIGGAAALAIAAELAEVRGNVAVTEVVIEDDVAAAARAFRGSPTVLVDGREIAPDPGVPIGSMG